MKVGYARVSSADQTLDRQLGELKQAGAEKIFQERLSGKNITDRVELLQALQFLREKDVLVVESLDRLGRITLRLFRSCKSWITRKSACRS